MDRIDAYKALYAATGHRAAPVETLDVNVGHIARAGTGVYFRCIGRAVCEVGYVGARRVALFEGNYYPVQDIGRLGPCIQVKEA